MNILPLPVLSDADKMAASLEKKNYLELIYSHFTIKTYVNIGMINESKLWNMSMVKKGNTK